MSTAYDGFADNWSYLRSELGWLDQVLLNAIARQRKQTKEIDRIAQSRADRVTHHWWKGIVSLEGHPSYDEYRKPASTAVSKLSFQQQMDLRTQSSQNRGVALGLPLLRDRLGLSVFEKNVILISLAPEINRRYARLYRYLKGEEESASSDLPSVDLVLRLLCRNDQEWSLARKSFATEAPLVRQGVVEMYTCTPDTRLRAMLRLTDPVVDFLLAVKPAPEALEQILQPSIGCGFQPAALQRVPLLEPALPWMTVVEPTTDWADLVLPADLKGALQAVCQRIQAQITVDRDWGFDQLPGTETLRGVLLVLSGPAGTGKTLAARAIAHHLQTSLTLVDLAQVDPAEAAVVADATTLTAPSVLLLQSAEYWFGRQAPSAQLHPWLAQRRQQPTITILSTTKSNGILPRWRADATVVRFPMPSMGDRQQLWERAFPAAVPFATELPWDWLAQNFTLSGGQIQAIAREAALYAAAAGESVTLSHILQACQQRGHTTKASPPVPSS